MQIDFTDIARLGYGLAAWFQSAFYFEFHLASILIVLSLSLLSLLAGALLLNINVLNMNKGNNCIQRPIKTTSAPAS